MNKDSFEWLQYYYLHVIVAFQIWHLEICKSKYDENKLELPVDNHN